MNHVRNIKEMLKIPNENRNMDTSSYSNLTDSQFFFGSQFWQETSQGTSQDMSLSPKNSQQSSQEGSDPKFLSNYHTKPLLFGDKIQTSGLLDQFEEDRKKAKERKDSELLAKELQHIRDNLINIQQLVAGTEKSEAVCQMVFEKVDNFSSTLQNSLKSLQDDISQKFEILVDKVNSQKELMAQLEERVQKNGDTTVELDPHLKSLRNCLEHLKEEQERQRRVFEEDLKHLSALLSEHSAKRSTEGVMESAIQTSPEPKESVSNFRQDNQLEVTQLTHASCNPKQHQGEASRKIQVFEKRKLSLRSHRRCKKRPLVLPQKSKSSVSDENSQPETHCKKPQTVSTPLCERCEQNTGTKQYNHNSDSRMSPNIGSRSGVAPGCFITPVNCWSQDSSSPKCLTLIEPILEKLAVEPKSQVKSFSLWQLFDSDFDF